MGWRKGGRCGRSGMLALVHSEVRLCSGVSCDVAIAQKETHYSGFIVAASISH